MRSVGEPGAEKDAIIEPGPLNCVVDAMHATDGIVCCPRIGTSLMEIKASLLAFDFPHGLGGKRGQEAAR
jgi:hypothetical protein